MKKSSEKTTRIVAGRRPVKRLRASAAAVAALALAVGGLTGTATKAEAATIPVPPPAPAPVTYGPTFYDLYGNIVSTWDDVEKTAQRVENSSAGMASNFPADTAVLAGDTLKYVGVVAVGYNNKPYALAGEGPDGELLPDGLAMKQLAADYTAQYGRNGIFSPNTGWFVVQTPDNARDAEDKAMREEDMPGLGANPKGTDEMSKRGISVDYEPSTDPGFSTTWPKSCAADYGWAATDGASGSQTVYNAWCLGVGRLNMTLTNIQPPANGTTEAYINFGIDPTNILNALYLAGPAWESIGTDTTNALQLNVLTPKLDLIKQVCTLYADGKPACTNTEETGWVDDTTAGDDNGTEGVAGGVTTGVEQGMVPPGVTQIMWRLTAKNTGNVALTNVHVAPGGEVTTGAAVATNGCEGLSIPISSPFGLMPGDSTSAVCTTTLSAPLTSGTIQNSAALNATLFQTFYAPDGTVLNDRLTGNGDEPDMVPSNVDSAQVVPATPGLKLTKYVCDTNVDATCTPPLSADLPALAGFVNGKPVQGTTPAGSPWVKQTTVSYGSDANWLVVATNIGNTYLSQVSLDDALTSTGGAGAMSNATKVSGDDPLAPGASMVWTLKTSSITNTGTQDDAFSTTTQIVSPFPNVVYDTGEPTYTEGTDVVNQATATGVPSDKEGNPLSGGDTPVLPPGPVPSNPSTAEVNTQVYAVGDYVWVDEDADASTTAPTDHNGQQDAGEPALPGVTVNLYAVDTSGTVAATPTATTTTDAAGYYYFDNLPAGKYQVGFVLSDAQKDAYMWTLANQGPAATDSDANQATGRSAVFTLGVGAPNMVDSTDASVPADYADKLTGEQINPTIDAGVVTPAPAVDIEKYDTAGGDNIVTGDHDDDQYLAQAGVPVPISFTVTNTGNEPLTSIVVTDRPANGSAEITDLSCTFPDGSKGTTWAGPFAVGAHFDCTGMLPGLAAGASHTDTASVTGTGQYSGKPVSDSDKWNAKAPSYAVGDYVWVDANHNGRQDPTEKPLAGVGVALLNADGTPVLVDGAPATTTTDAAGYYFFDMLSAGSYKVQFTLPTGYVWTTPETGSPVTDSDAVFTANTDATASSSVFTLGPDAPNMVPAASAPGDYADKLVSATIDPTWDAGVVVPTPKVDIQKYDTLGGDDIVTGDFDKPDGKVLAPGVDVPISFTITNTGQEALVDVSVTDKTIDGTGDVQNIVCTFPDGSKGTTWAGPFAVNASFGCTGTLPGLSGGQFHGDEATVTGTGQISGMPVNAKDQWHGEVPLPLTHVVAGGASSLAVSFRDLRTAGMMLLFGGGLVAVALDLRRRHGWLQR